MNINQSSKGFPIRSLCAGLLSLLLLGLWQLAVADSPGGNRTLQPVGEGKACAITGPESGARRVRKAAETESGIAERFMCNQIGSDFYANYGGVSLYGFGEDKYAFFWGSPYTIFYDDDKTVLKYNNNTSNRFFYFRAYDGADPIVAIKVYLDTDRTNNATVNCWWADFDSDPNYFYYEAELEAPVCDFENGVIYWCPEEGYDFDNVCFLVTSGQLHVKGVEFYSKGRVPGDFMTTGQPTYDVAAPIFKPDVRDFTSPISVEITAEEGTDIYYRTDEYYPSIRDNDKYTGPITISTTTTFRAIAVNANGDISPVSSATYTCHRHGIGEDYDPSDPGDPEGEKEPVEDTRHRLTILANPAESGSISPYTNLLNEGKGTNVWASNWNGFVFDNWTIDGEIISTSPSLYYVMPDHDVTIFGNFHYDPDGPGDPNPLEQIVKHPVVTRAVPSIGGRLDPSGSFTMDENSTRRIYAYPNDGWKLVGWTVNGDTLETKTSPITVTMGEKALDIAAFFKYDPSTPGSPAKNYWDPNTGEVIIDDFTPGNIVSVFSNFKNFDTDSVKSVIVKGQMSSNDFSTVRNWCYNATVVDLARVEGVETVPYWAFQEMNASRIFLPACVTNIQYGAFYGCPNLTSLVMYSPEPPKYNTSYEFGNKDNCTLYVPESAVELYKAADFWKDFTILPNSPNSVFGVNPADPNGWNDLSLPHSFTMEGKYESPLGQWGRIQYEVDGSEEWTDLTGNIPSGSTYNANLVATFTEGKEVHTINLRVIDSAGNITMLEPMTYKDVSFHPVMGIEDKVYCWGDTIYQTALECDLPAEEYMISGYADNINAGDATFCIEGVYPHTIGRKAYSFKIEPLPLTGGITLAESEFVYDGNHHQPSWTFSEEAFRSLEWGRDFEVEWKDDLLPGTGSLTVKGKGNFKDELSAEFFIDRAPLTSDRYSLQLPGDDIIFDGKPHGAAVTISQGVGRASISYAEAGSEENTEEAPVAAGSYDVYLEIAEGAIYHGMSLAKVHSFSIYEMDEDDWNTIETVAESLAEKGWEDPWDISGGTASAPSLEGLTIEKGHVVAVDLSGQNLTGSFPTELLSFKDLRSINLADNGFSGGLDEVFALSGLRAAVMPNNVESIDISNNEFDGNVGVFASAFPALKSLDVSGNHISDIYPMISPTVTQLNLGSQTIDRTIDVDLSDLDVEALTAQIPSVLLYNHEAQSFDNPLALRCSADEGWSVVMTYADGKVGFSDVSEQNAYHGQSGDVLEVSAKTPYGKDSDSYLKMKLDFETSDSNFDGEVSILDLQTSVLFAFDEYKDLPFNFTAADTYADGRINVQDVICTANILLGKESADEQALQMRAAGGAASAEAYVYVDGNRLCIESSRQVAAMDILLSDGAEWNVERYGFTTASTPRHLVGWSMSGMTLPSGMTEIGEVAEGTKVLRCVLSDENARPIKAVAASAAVGVGGMESECDGEAAYGLDGRRTDLTGRGVVIIVGRNGSKKILNSNN